MNSKEYKNQQDHQYCLEETETIELKSGIAELEDAVIDICALLNNKVVSFISELTPRERLKVW